MIKGIAASSGVGVGLAVVMTAREVPQGTAPAGAPGGVAATSTGGATPGAATAGAATAAASEKQRFRAGREIALSYYQDLVGRVRDAAGEEEAEIFEGHIEILGGEDLEEGVDELITNTSISAEDAVRAFCEENAQEFEELESEYFQQRASDIRDIGSRLAEAIHFGSIADLGDIPEESVIVAEELSPSATARLDLGRVVAIVTEKGGRTSHAAILARSLAIPCVTGVPGVLAQVPAGQLVAVDGDSGEVWPALDPKGDSKTLESFRQRANNSNQLKEQRREWSKSTPAQTADGRSILLSANIGTAAEAEAAREIGAAGSGLVRSEFFFMRVKEFPSRKQQAEEYRKICAALAPHTVTIRLLDCGADKPLPYAQQSPEDNPYLGERGIRFLMNRTEQLRNQVEAISEIAAEGYAVKLMIPMVISASEVRVVREAAVGSVSIGIMVETPASVIALDRLLPEVEFVSIGTNDLTQYILAVDRGNAGVAPLYQEFHPAVLAAIDYVVNHSHAAGVPVGVCGDMASRPASAVALLALGVDQLSAGIDAIPDLKAALRKVTSQDLENLARQLLSAPDADTARQAAEKLVHDVGRPWE
ncbi:MAG: phosphoenolpyruvate--protein phosphotransferase [Spirochaetaceae bacterium]|nr:MAG: phosphoenolpyruvate--protein phosphotransferase [Spirochaetaceae bacterium]